MNKPENDFCVIHSFKFQSERIFVLNFLLEIIKMR